MMTKDSLAAHIKSVVHLSDEQLDFILTHFKFSNHEKNSLILKEGQVGKHLNFVVKGSLRIYMVKEDGQESTRHLAFEGQYATGLASFITGRPSFENIQATEDTTLLRITRKDFYYLLDIIPAWERFYRDYIEIAYINNLQIYQREVTKDAELRYKELLNYHPQAIHRLPNKIVASYLNMSPETLSRIKTKFKF